VISSSITISYSGDSAHLYFVCLFFSAFIPFHDVFHFTMKKTASSELPILGWREWVALPDLGVSTVKAKVDTGARSSSLHVVGLEEFEKEGSIWVRFRIHPRQRSSEVSVSAEAPVLERRSVRSSSGKASVRPVIITHISLLNGFPNVTWPGSISRSIPSRCIQFLLWGKACSEKSKKIKF
jgi:hypothetical protein